METLEDQNFIILRTRSGKSARIDLEKNLLIKNHQISKKKKILLKNPELIIEKNKEKVILEENKRLL